MYTRRKKINQVALFITILTCGESVLLNNSLTEVAVVFAKFHSAYVHKIEGSNIPELCFGSNAMSFTLTTATVQCSKKLLAKSKTTKRATKRRRECIICSFLEAFNFRYHKSEI
ncbi:Hypothetical predicted protein [Octopus vulgaris]|uniref:Uncharacterized protein n=1 Tax=Octopus vulgaris TaxID=6645 RepID=A0AA36BCH3_OCTVU|nr:Hypothetical predicted protein [Octopus vulgaris]